MRVKHATYTFGPNIIRQSAGMNDNKFVVLGFARQFITLAGFHSDALALVTGADKIDVSLFN